MARIILNCSYDPPIGEFSTTVHPCFVARSIAWVRSFVAIDGTRSICEFEADYAEMVRDACRQGGIPYEQIWRAAIDLDSHLSLQSPDSTVIVSEGVNDSSVSPPAWRDLQNESHPEQAEDDLQPIHTLMSVDGQHAVWIFNAATEEVVQQAHQRARIPFMRIWRSRLVLPSMASTPT